MPNHPHIFIVEDENLHRQTILGGGAKLLNIHLDRCLAGNVDDQCVGIAELRADRGGKAIAHRAEATAGQPFIGAFEIEMLGGPHLVLTDLGGDDRFAFMGRLPQSADCFLRHDFFFVLGIFQTIGCPPSLDP